MYYVFMMLGPTAGMAKKSAVRLNTQPHVPHASTAKLTDNTCLTCPQAQITWGNRAFGNLHEQSTIFLVSLWFHALFVSVEGAATMGWAYVIFRGCYPLLWAICGPMPGSVRPHPPPPPPPPPPPRSLCLGHPRAAYDVHGDFQSPYA